MKRIKTIKSHSGLSAFLSEVSESPVAFIPLCELENVAKDRYSYSPAKCVWELNGRKVIYFETAHKRYEVYEVPPQFRMFKTDEEATDFHIRFVRKA